MSAAVVFRNSNEAVGPGASKISRANQEGYFDERQPDWRVKHLVVYILTVWAPRDAASLIMRATADVVPFNRPAHSLCSRPTCKAHAAVALREMAEASGNALCLPRKRAVSCSKAAVRHAPCYWSRAASSKSPLFTAALIPRSARESMCTSSLLGSSLGPPRTSQARGSAALAAYIAFGTPPG